MFIVDQIPFFLVLSTYASLSLRLLPHPPTEIRVSGEARAGAYILGSWGRREQGTQAPELWGSNF